ncbi:hypothetical protein GCM10009549_28110 [Streptomyces thermoalcalitolerans]|uniref:Uncharacterized protein n=1 Tax=Streptomyces thermoalcalitolerans TaxID=65605 RepID=A0ABN1NQJ7_9ACTN
MADLYAEAADELTKQIAVTGIAGLTGRRAAVDPNAAVEGVVRFPGINAPAKAIVTPKRVFRGGAGPAADLQDEGQGGKPRPERMKHLVRSLTIASLR